MAALALVVAVVVILYLQSLDRRGERSKKASETVEARVRSAKLLVVPAMSGSEANSYSQGNAALSSSATLRIGLSDAAFVLLSRFDQWRTTTLFDNGRSLLEAGEHEAQCGKSPLVLSPGDFARTKLLLVACPVPIPEQLPEAFLRALPMGQGRLPWRPVCAIDVLGQ